MSITLPREAPPPSLTSSSLSPLASGSRSSSGVPASSSSAIPPVGEASGPSPFARLLHGLGRESNQGEAMMKSALGAGAKSGNLGSADLLALQAGVYRYGEVVDLASRLVDRATSAVKTVVQGQGQ